MNPDSHLADIVDLLVRESATSTEEQARTRRAGYWNITTRIDIVADGWYYCGSGLLVSSNGYVITNHHVAETIANPEDTTIAFHGGLYGDNVYCAQLERSLRVHPGYDLALLKFAIDPDLATHIEQSTPRVVFAAEPIREYEEVRVYGFAHGMSEDRPGVITKRCPVSIFPKFGERRVNLVTWLTTVETEQGFSGGPVVRPSTGELIGVTWGEMLSNDPDRKTVREHAFVEIDAVKLFLADYVVGEAKRVRKDRFLRTLRDIFA